MPSRAIAAAVLGAGVWAAGPASAVVPPIPSGCVPATTTVTSNAEVSILNLSVVSSTVVVAGAGIATFDVNVTTFVRHTFAADLDVTLTSPAGTVVTLTSDNGAGNDDVFDGTVWDDQANDPVTDRAYANSVVVPTLSPEDKLDAFRNEDPNGTWTLTISDDLASDTGTLDAWTLEITTFGIVPDSTTVTAGNTTPTAITDVATVQSDVVVAGAATYLSDVNLTTAIVHDFSANLDVTLTSPAGTVVTIATDNGSSHDNVWNGTLWDDDADPGNQVPYANASNIGTDAPYTNLTVVTPLVPEGPLAAFIGEDPNGTWTITVTDDTASNTGSLDSWSLQLATASCGPVVPTTTTRPSTSTTTTTAAPVTSTTLPGCAPDVSIEAVACRLAELADDVSTVVTSDPLSEAVRGKITASLAALEQARTASSDRIRKRALNKARNKLNPAKRLLASRKVKKAVTSDAARLALIAGVNARRADLKTLRAQ